MKMPKNLNEKTPNLTANPRAAATGARMRDSTSRGVRWRRIGLYDGSGSGKDRGSNGSGALMPSQYAERQIPERNSGYEQRVWPSGQTRSTGRRAIRPGGPTL